MRSLPSTWPLASFVIPPGKSPPPARGRRGRALYCWSASRSGRHLDDSPRVAGPLPRRRRRYHGQSSMPRKRASGPAFTVEFPRPLPAEREGEQWWMAVDGRDLRLSNLDKVFWPEEGYTKGDLVAYYFNVAERILPYLAGRPLTMKRMPD